MDMLSNLPEPILCHILSFLPTKTAAACSILSKKWQFLWSSVPVLDFNMRRDVSGYYQAEEFLDLVDKVLHLPREFPIKKFRLRYGHIQDSGMGEDYLPEWLSACRALVELDLAFHCVHLTFPRSLGNYNNLLILKLSDGILGCVESGLFPKVRVLHLLEVAFEDDEGGSFENFLSACPALQELVWRKRSSDRCASFRICVPTLTTLVVQRDDLYRSDRVCSHFELVLETPALEYLNFKHQASHDSLVTTNLCNLRKADIGCIVLKADKSCGSHVMNLLTKLSTVKYLKLSCDKMIEDPYEWIFQYWRGLVDGFDYSCLNELPVFNNLVRFELCIPSCDCVLLPHLLQKFHNLKHIVIDIKVCHIQLVEACWTEPLQVPICLSSTLLSFYLHGFDGFQAERKLVEYVMKHAKVLKKMIVNTSPYFKACKARLDRVQELPTVSRGSEAFQLHIMED